MAVTAPNDTLRKFFLDSGPRTTSVQKVRYTIQFFPAHMIELEHCDVFFSAVHTRMLLQVLH